MRRHPGFWQRRLARRQVEQFERAQARRQRAHDLALMDMAQAAAAHLVNTIAAEGALQLAAARVRLH